MNLSELFIRRAITTGLLMFGILLFLDCRELSHQQAVVKLNTGVGSVAKRLILGCPAATERHPVPPFVMLAIRGFDGDAAAYPERTATVLPWILHHADGRGKLVLDLLARLLIMFMLYLFLRTRSIMA